ncbi:hypothetical protein F1188_18380 [Roseospira marina]|uniref:Lipoprotein n=1 Tax=Roseospira marina TaxID=140057 RepID=A0A5M6I704_9PROT|nr:hypothetical protein [Roseospira marina]KAA5603903.1 hypothetical protein F1188_18380 [Roseospira marina]MBB4315964.1 uncharacterized protein (DUF3084 family) [Roseospira marina]MBB5089166.1 uncharacterized protein (DUF3084 family) [Roseospira marina]
MTVESFKYPRRAMGRAVFAAAAASAVVALAGCVSTSDCDPNQANFFSAAACEGTGVAQDREDMTEQQARRAEARVAALREDLSRARADLRLRQQERRSLEQRASDLDREVLRLRGLLARAEQVEGVNQSRLNDLQTRLDTLQASTAATSSPSTREIERSEAEAEAILAETDALLGLTS